MTVDLEAYETLLANAPLDSESVTYLLVSGATAAELAAAVRADLGGPVIDILVEGAPDDADHSCYAFAEVDGGVLAMEPSGYADPSNSTLRRLSVGGRTAAVARSNIQAHCRFGYARDGELVFDDDEYVFVEDLMDVPEEVRDLAALVWDNFEDDEREDEHDWLGVAFTMASRVTGLAVSADDLRRAHDAGFRLVPSLTYLED